eukprot:9913241-Ditylum_brightwellii.AAC.2
MPYALALWQPTPHTAIDDTDDALPQHMLVPEGEVVNEETPSLIQCDDDTYSKDNDDDVDVEPSPPCQYPHRTTRGSRPTLYQEEFPHVTGIAEYDPADSQARLVEEFNTMQDLDGYVNAVHPLVFAAKANALDMPNYYQAMNQPDAPLFVKAMEEEMAAIEALEAWEIIDQAEVPYIARGIRRTLIECTWAFKVKKIPDGSVKKRKAQLCMCGDQQVEGIDYFETYAPVVS